MPMRLASLALVTVLSCVAACTTPYDFRDGDRPTTSEWSFARVSRNVYIH
ncbi:MAG: hypothetical protein OEV41_11915 [Gammaproteobacteria bacterium]|nr:hypothetical protein [Gammaproteobacteria bacterium]